MVAVLYEPTGELQTTLGLPAPASEGTMIDLDLLGDPSLGRRLTDWDVGYTRLRLRFDATAPQASGVIARTAWITTVPTPTLLGWVSAAALPDLVEVQIADRDNVSQNPESGALGAIDTIAATLALPPAAVVRAAGINRRSYYHWKANPDVQPRLASTARLWELAQSVRTLEDYLEDRVAMWLRASKERARLLEKGKFDELIWLAMRDSTAGLDDARAARQRAAAAVGAFDELDGDLALGDTDSRPIRAARRAVRAQRAVDEE